MDKDTTFTMIADYSIRLNLSDEVHGKVYQDFEVDHAGDDEIVFSQLIATAVQHTLSAVKKPVHEITITLRSVRNG